MNQLGFPLLSILIFVPLLGGLAVLVVGRNRTVAKVWALLVTLVDLALGGVLWGFFNYGQAGMQFVDRLTWIKALGVHYSVGVDGVSLWLILLTVVLTPVAVLASGKFLDGRPEAEAGPFLCLVLALESGVLGVFAAADLILFYICWEAVLVPLYFLIGRWGGERRRYATLKFFLYTMAGSALMLVAILSLATLNYQQTGVLTFELTALYDLPLAFAAQVWLLVAFLLAFGVKAPIWPLHTWLPDAYGESCTPVTILLAGVLSKMGIYGLIRFALPLFPEAMAVVRPWVWLLAIVGILYGSLVALVQKDIKRLVAYSSLAHMGTLVVGVLAANAQGVQGALLYSVSHGLTVSALFLIVDMLERRRHTRQMAAFGGLWRSVPLLGSLTLAVAMASAGLPGLSAFPGEFTLLVGLFRESTAAAVFATLGIVLGAWYMLNLFRKVFAGPVDHPENRSLPDVRRREAAVLLPLVALILIVGILPNLVLQPTQAAVGRLLDQAAETTAAAVEGGN